MPTKNFYISENDRELFDELEEGEDSLSKGIRKAVRTYLSEDLNLDPILVEGVNEYAKKTEKSPNDVLNELVAAGLDSIVTREIDGEENYPFRHFAEKYYREGR